MAGGHTGGRDMFFEGAPFASLLLDGAGTVVAVNRAARNLLAGAGSGPVVGEAFSALLDAEGRAVWSVALHELGASDRLEPTMTRLAGDGATREVMLTASAWPDEEGERAAVMVGLVDVGERLRLESEARLVADRYRSIMQAARDAIVALDAAGRITLTNDAAREMFGARGNRLLGEPVETLVAPEERPRLRAALEQAGRGPEHGVTRLELRALRGDDAPQEFPAALSLSAFHVGAGTHYTAIVRDESEPLALRRELERKARLLERKNEELEAFSYSVSHALKAPLRTMGSFAGLVLARYGDQLDEAGQRYLRFLLDSCDEQSRQVEQLLELSHLARSEDAFEDVDTAALVRRLVDTHLLHAGERDIDVAIDGDLPVVRGQRVALHHLFDNLIGNAVKFTAREPVAHIAVGYEYAAAAEEHHFRIRDDGIGIAPQDVDSIFRLFERLHGREEFEGTGAGLNIALKSLERHGGRIEVESTPGEGTTFHVFLPRRPGPDLDEANIE
ncbi:MAG: sensor histidine kinase [Myxococcota bacterium]